MAYSPIARTLVIAEDGRLAAHHARSLCPATISQWSKGRAFFPGSDCGARAPERCGRKSEAGVDLHDRAFGQGARRSDREIGEPLGRPNAKSSQSQYSADSITFIGIRHDGPDGGELMEWARILAYITGPWTGNCFCAMSTWLPKIGS
jgi:hypothetical protein